MQHSRERSLRIARRSLTQITRHAVLPPSIIGNHAACVRDFIVESRLTPTAQCLSSLFSLYSPGLRPKVPWIKSTPSRLESGVPSVSWPPKSLEEFQFLRVTAYLAGEHRVIYQSFPQAIVEPCSPGRATPHLRIKKESYSWIAVLHVTCSVATKAWILLRVFLRFYQPLSDTVPFTVRRTLIRPRSAQLWQATRVIVERLSDLGVSQFPWWSTQGLLSGSSLCTAKKDS